MSTPSTLRNNPAPTPALPNEPAGRRKTYRVGTLQYTLRGLIVLFAWLLWGDFCFVLFEGIFGRFMPLYLKQLQASDMWISVLTGSTAGLMNLLFLPHISMWSDRHRSRRGRRVPFLFWATPATVGALCLIGFSPEIGAWICAHIPLPAVVTKVTVILLILSVFVVAFHFFNMVLWNMFSCFLRDVVPTEVMPWCLSGFRVVGTVGGLLFNWLIFPHVLINRQAVCVGVGLLYLVAFMAMCWRVKEGEYPPAAEKPRGNVLQTYGGYFKTCLSLPIYRNYFIMYVTLCMGGLAGNQFGILFQQRTLGLSLTEIGNIGNWCIGMSLIALLSAGYLCRKFSPFRVYPVTMVCGMTLSLLSYFFVHDKATLLAFSLVGTVPGAIGGIASGTINVMIFPKDKYGQFASGMNVFSYGCITVCSFLVGHVMDVSGHNYRLIYLLGTAGGIVALVPLTLFYRGLKQHGGIAAFTPPVVP